MSEQDLLEAAASLEPKKRVKRGKRKRNEDNNNDDGDDGKHKTKKHKRTGDKKFNCLRYVSVEKEWRNFSLTELRRFQKGRSEKLIEQHRKDVLNEAAVDEGTGGGRRKSPSKKASEGEDEASFERGRLKTWTREKHGKKWCSIEAAAELAKIQEERYFESNEETNAKKKKKKKKRGNLFGPPQVTKEVKSALNGVMYEIGRQTLLGLKSQLQSPRKKTADISDWASCVMTKHGLKRSMELIANAAEDLKSQVEDKEEEWKKTTVISDGDDRSNDDNE